MNNLLLPSGVGVDRIEEKEESFADKSDYAKSFFRAGFPGLAGCPGNWNLEARLFDY